MTGNHTEQPSKEREKKRKDLENQISKKHRERNARLFQWTTLWGSSERCCMFSVSVFALCGLWQREYLVDKTA